MTDLEQLKCEVHENNLMLKEIIKFINTNYQNDNFNDFVRNVFANLVSNKFVR